MSDTTESIEERSAAEELKTCREDLSLAERGRRKAESRIAELEGPAPSDEQGAGKGKWPRFIEPNGNFYAFARFDAEDQCHWFTRNGQKHIESNKGFTFSAALHTGYQELTAAEAEARLTKATPGATAEVPAQAQCASGEVPAQPVRRPSSVDAMNAKLRDAVAARHAAEAAHAGAAEKGTGE